MFRKLSLLIGFTLVLSLAGTAYAQGPPPSGHSAPTWEASYWNNINLSGDPVTGAFDTRLDFNWGSGAPRAGVNADQFSARWTRYIDMQAGTYQFTVMSDDGVRVFVDGRLIIDQWHDRPAQRYATDLALSAGHHLVVVEYYENMGDASINFSWAPVPPSFDNWRGEYFNNRWLNGSPYLVREDMAINFDWGYNSPAAGIPGDGFSVRWRRIVNLDAGSYRFTAISDDGIRVFVDGRLIIDQWHDHAPSTYHADVTLTAGQHTITVEYYENGGLAVSRFWWEPSPAPPTHRAWRAEYFDNRWLSGSAVLVRDEAGIDHNWGDGSPSSAIPADGFSIRWTRTLRFDAGSYRFSATTDDGVRLWVNGHLLLDHWRDQSFTSHSGTIHVAGDVPIKMEYYENGGTAAAKLTWERVDDGSPAPQPDGVIVDDADSGFVKGGIASGWRTADEGYDGRLTWTRNSRSARGNYNWARWYPDLAPGRYEVLVYIPERYTTTSYARYWIRHRGGYTLRHVNQSTNGSRWISLGTYSFRGTRDDYVSLADVTYEPHATRLIAFDAVKWVPR